MEPFLTLPGSSALSNFRLRALAHELNAERVLTRHVHYVAFHADNREQFQDEDQHILDQLLEYGEAFQEDVEIFDEEENTTFYVSPRVGTISPWVRAY